MKNVQNIQIKGRRQKCSGLCSKTKQCISSKRCKTRSYQTFQEQCKDYPGATINELATNSKSKDIRDLERIINDFMKNYQPRTNLVNDEKSDLIKISHNILARWRNHFCQQLNVYGFNVVRQTEIHTADPIVPTPSTFGFQVGIQKLKRHITRCTTD